MRDRLLNAVALAALVALVAGLAGCGQKRADGTTTWRFAIEENQGSVQDAYAQRFKQLIEQRSHGAIKVEVYTYGALGTSDQITELVHDGSIQFAMASPGHLGKVIPPVQVFLLHFLLSPDEDVNNAALADPQLKATLDPLYRAKNFKLLSIYTEGWQVWTIKKPVVKPSDFDGVKMRVMTTPLLMAAYRAYGASPTPLPYSEVYSALQLNMIDGQVNPLFAIEEMSFYEVADYMIFPHSAEFVTTAMTNEDFYDGLSPGRQKLVLGVVHDLQGYIDGVQRRFNDERLDTIKKKRPDLHIIHLTPTQRDRFRQASLPVRAEFVNDTGPAGKRVLDQLKAAVARAEQRAGPTAEDDEHGSPPF